MPNGIPVNREWIVVLNNGIPLLDWEDGRGIDLLSGEFIQYDSDLYSHPIQDDELEVLRRAGRITEFNDWKVYVASLPEVPSRTIS